VEYKVAVNEERSGAEKQLLSLLLHAPKVGEKALEKK